MRLRLKSVGLVLPLAGSITIILEKGYANALSAPTLTAHSPVLAQITTQDRKAEADRLLQQGNQQVLTSQYEAASQSYEQALALYRAITDRNAEINVTISFPISTVQLSKLAQTTQAAKAEADWLAQKATTQYEEGKFEDALKTLQQELTIRKAIKDQPAEGKALNNIGLLYRRLSKYADSLESYKQALEIFKRIKNPQLEAITLNNIGLVQSYLGQYLQALNDFKESLTIFQKINDLKGESSVLNNIGFTYQNIGDYSNALTFFKRALNIEKTLFGGDHPEVMSTLINLGQVYRSQGKCPEALELYQRAYAITSRLGPIHNDTGVILSNIGTMYDCLGEYSNALKKYQEAISIFSRFGDRNGEAIALNNIGEIYRKLSEYNKALALYQEALVIIRHLKNSEEEGIILSNIGDVQRIQNQPELAIVFYKQSVNVRETIRQDIRKLPRELQESYTQSVAGTYRALADLLITQGRIGEAQQVLERLKIQEINDFTKGTRAPTAIAEVGFSPVENQVKGKYTSLIAFGGKFYECEQQRCPQYNELKTQYQNLSKEFQSFIEQIKQQLRDSRLTQVDKSTQDFQNSADRVVTAHPNSILIYPLVLADKTRLLWASKGGVLSKTAVCPLGEKALYAKVSQLQTLISQRGDESKLKDVGKELYECLVKPLEGELTVNQIKHLIFVPDRATNYIPIGALFDGKQYLIQRFAISTVLSASLTDTASRLSSASSTPVLALGLSQAVSNYSPLPNVETELKAIVKQSGTTGIYPGTIFLNQQFTKAALEDNIRGHRILHIATHGEFKPENPRSSYFLLGTGVPYPIPDVQTLRDLKDIHLVVLSACKTGLGGADGLGLEVSGISSFFLGDRDRAKAVMASLWDVSDASTSLLMQQFYQNLAKGMGKAAALQNVQQDFIDGKLTAKDAPQRATLVVQGTPGRSPATDFSHPYYWAPFILIGNGL